MEEDLSIRKVFFFFNGCCGTTVTIATYLYVKAFMGV
jgi:hypothetical protein